MSLPFIRFGPQGNSYGDLSTTNGDLPHGDGTLWCWRESENEMRRETKFESEKLLRVGVRDLLRGEKNRIKMTLFRLRDPKKKICILIETCILAIIGRKGGWKRLVWLKNTPPTDFFFFFFFISKYKSLLKQD